MDEQPRPRRVAYLSAAPRVTTDPYGEESGPRAHVMGVMSGFRALGWAVEPYVVGDMVPRQWREPGSLRRLDGSSIRRVAADVLRVAMGAYHARRAIRTISGPLDLVYERLCSLQSLGWIFRRGGTPWVLETNGLLFEEATSDRSTVALKSLARRRELAAYAEADAVVCVSHALRDLVVKEARISEDKVLVMPNGVDLARFDPAGRKPDRIFQGTTIGFVGQLFGWQGLDMLVEALFRVKSECDFSLVIVGDGAVRSVLEEMVRARHMQSYVRFLGRVPADRVPGLLLGFDLTFSGQTPLHVGRMYHSPLKIYESLAVGRPVLASAYNDARRLLADGRCGFLFDPERPGSLEAALRQVWRERRRLPAMAEVARACAIEEHGWDRRVAAMLSAVRNVATVRS